MARILVVEDDDSVREFTARALAVSGHEVVTAADGGQGLQEACREENRFGLVLSDIRMPVMDGIEMARRLAAARPGTRILLMTGYAEQREMAADLASIVIDVLPKPFSLAELRRSVDMAIAG
jgi:two-component system cell cycle response regulator CpdR